MASCGSGDGFVYVYDTTSLAIKWARGEGVRRRYRLPGHRSIVNDVDFHPIEPIICSVSSDHSVIMGEILPWRVCGKQKSDTHISYCRVRSLKTMSCEEKDEENRVSE